MDSKYDIFRILPNGQRLWAGTVTGLEKAKKRLAKLESLAPGEYQVYDVRDGIMVGIWNVQDQSFARDSKPERAVSVCFCPWAGSAQDDAPASRQAILG